MSCRIIGRKIEYYFMDFIVNFLKKKGVKIIKSKYLPTIKNIIVSDFYDNCKFKLVSSNKEEKKYILKISNYKKLNKLNFTLEHAKE